MCKDIVNVHSPVSIETFTGTPTYMPYYEACTVGAGRFGRQSSFGNFYRLVFGPSHIGC